MRKEIPLFLAGAALAAITATASADTTVSANTVAPPPAASDAVKALQQVRLPVLRGGDLKSSASAAGFGLKDGRPGAAEPMRARGADRVWSHGAG